MSLSDLKGGMHAKGQFFFQPYIRNYYYGDISRRATKFGEVTHTWITGTFLGATPHPYTGSGPKHSQYFTGSFHFMPRVDPLTQIDQIRRGNTREGAYFYSVTYNLP